MRSGTIKGRPSSVSNFATFFSSGVMPLDLVKPLLVDVLPVICFVLQDVFTVSVGNLPAGCVALIKITYVSELQVEGELINFSIPGSVAPWKQEANNTEVRLHFIL